MNETRKLATRHHLLAGKETVEARDHNQFHIRIFTLLCSDIGWHAQLTQFRTKSFNLNVIKKSASSRWSESTPRP